MAWSISPGGTFAGLSVTGCSRNLQAGGRSTCEITFAKSLATAHAFEEDDVVTVTGPSGVFFTGVVERPGRSAGGGAQNHTLTLTTKWKWLEEIAYTQPYASGSGSATIRKSTVVLGLADNGTRQTTAQIISGIISFANGQGAGITPGSILPGVTLKPPLMQACDLTCAEAIRTVLRWHPDAVLTFEPDGTLNILRPASMPAISRTVGGAARTSQCELAPRQSLALRGVVVHYEITTTVDGTEYVSIVNDSAGSTTGRRVAHFTVPLRGPNIVTQQQVIQTKDIPDEIGELGDWLSEKFDEIRDGAPGPGDLLVHSFTQVVKEDEKVGPGAALDEYPRELIVGTIQPWMSGVSAAPTGITIDIEFTGDAALKPELAKLFPGTAKREKFFVTVMGTDALDQTYRTSGGSGGEAVPEGLADDYLEAFQTVPDAGVYTSLAADPDVELVAGMLLSLSGSATVADSPVQSVSVDVFSGATTVTFGPMNQALAPADWLELLRAGQRQQPLVNPSGSIRTDASAGAGGGTVHGASGGRLKNTSRTVSATAVSGLVPWACDRSGDLDLRVWPSEIWDGAGNHLWPTIGMTTTEAEAYYDFTVTTLPGSSGHLYLECTVDGTSNDLHGIITAAALKLDYDAHGWFTRSGTTVLIPICSVAATGTSFTFTPLRSYVFCLRRYGPPGSTAWDVTPM